MMSGPTTRLKIIKLSLLNNQDKLPEVIIENAGSNKHKQIFNYLQNFLENVRNKKTAEIKRSQVSVNFTRTEMQVCNKDSNMKKASNAELDLEKWFHLISQSIEKNRSKTDTRKKVILKDAPETVMTNTTTIDMHPKKDLIVPSVFDISSSTNEKDSLEKDRFVDNETKSSLLLGKSISDALEHKQKVKRNEIDINYKDDYVKTNVTSVHENQMNIEDVNELAKQDKTCTQCLMTFKYTRHLGRHLEGHQKNNCLHCNAKFARRKHLQVHLFRVHGERVTKYPYACDMCPRSFPKKTLLNHHRSKHNYEGGKVCSECGEMLRADVSDKEHKENQCIKRQFQCKRCLQTFSIKQTYLAHLQNHENHKCSECDVAFASKKKAQEHYRMMHTPKQSNVNVNKEGKLLNKEGKLLNKEEDDTFIKTFACSICTKKLISQRALDQHIRRTHRGEKRFSCDIYDCTFQCSRRSDLDRHKQLHVEQRNVICEHCGKSFTSVSILNDHVLYVHNKEKQFVCEECGKAFKRNSSLKRHKLSHQQHRPFACMQCDTAFKRSHHLTRHLETCHRIILERKRKVVKLMKTEDGHLVPVPEKSKNINSSKTLNASENRSSMNQNEKSQYINANAALNCLKTNIQCELSSQSSDEINTSDSSLELPDLTPTAESTPHVLSLVNINSGEVVTVELASPETLDTNDLIDQFEINSSEITGLSDYGDLEFHSSILNSEQNYYDHSGYSELQLTNVEGTSLLLDSNINKVDILPTMENYLTQPFSSFLNL